MEIAIFFAIICLIILICYSYIHFGEISSNNDASPSPGNNAADALLDSPYYSQYRTTFDLIWYNGRQPRYKIDWLLLSLDMGRELENGGSYVVKSMEEKLPYFCETEYEYDLFYKSESPVMKGSVDGMMNLAFFYNEVNKSQFHPKKLNYWQKRIRKQAYDGDFEAQGALCSGYATIVFSREESEQFKEWYQAGLLKAAEEGNATAQLAVGKYLNSKNMEERMRWLRKSAKQGLSDAWYELKKAYDVIFNLNDDFQPRETPLPEEEAYQLQEKMAKCLFQGAKADNGVMAAWCQYMTGVNYQEGNFCFPKDLEKAKYWFHKSYENGCNYAKNEIENMNRHPEWY